VAGSTAQRRKARSKRGNSCETTKRKKKEKRRNDEIVERMRHINKDFYYANDN